MCAPRGAFRVPSVPSELSAGLHLGSCLSPPWACTALGEASNRYAVRSPRCRQLQLSAEASGQCNHRPRFSAIVRTVAVLDHADSDPGRGPCLLSEVSETLWPLQQQNPRLTTRGDAADPHCHHGRPSSPSGMSSFQVIVHILVNFHRVEC